MIISADDIQAEHDAAMASLTPAQHRAIARLRNAKQATPLPGRPSDRRSTVDLPARGRTAHDADRRSKPASPSRLMALGRLIASAAGVLTLAAAPAATMASEVYGGVFAHDVDLGMTRCCNETGADIQLGLRGDPIVSLNRWGDIRLYVQGSVNTNGGGGFRFRRAGVAASPRSERLHPARARHCGPGRVRR